MRGERKYWLVLFSAILLMLAIIFDGTYRGEMGSMFVWDWQRKGWLVVQEYPRIPILCRLISAPYDRLMFGPSIADVLDGAYGPTVRKM
jgi:hypothetical protein